MNDLDIRPAIMLHNFEFILEALKAETGTAYRKGWNGKNMQIFYVPPKTCKANTFAEETVANENGYVYHHGYIMLKTADDKFIPWIASQTDLLAEDWVFEKYPFVDYSELKEIY